MGTGASNSQLDTSPVIFLPNLKIGFHDFPHFSSSHASMSISRQYLIGFLPLNLNGSGNSPFLSMRSIQCKLTPNFPASCRGFSIFKSAILFFQYKLPMLYLSVPMFSENWYKKIPRMTGNLIEGSFLN